MVAATRVLVLMLGLLACGSADALQVTPVQKVIELLGELQTKVQEQGKDEAVQYDKFACFCKEQADNKMHAITKSNDLIEELGAEIQEVTATINGLNTEIATLITDIADLTWEIGNATETRNNEHQAFLGSEEDMKTALAQIEAAIESIKGSKASMEGDVKLDLRQVHEAAGHMLALLSSVPHIQPTGPEVASLTSLLQDTEPGKPQGYVFRSNKIILLLQGLYRNFTQDLKELQETEFQTNAQFESRTLGLSNSKTFKGKDKMEKEALVATKSEQLSEAQKAQSEEITARNADQSFLNVLQTQCESRAQEWDQRSKSRAAELTAIAEALEILKSGVEPKYGANRKLVGLEQNSTVLKRAFQQKQHSSRLRGAGPATPQSSSARVVAAHPHQQPGFFQEASVQDHISSQAVQKVAGALQASADKLQSKVLLSLATKLSVGIDHFEKVRGLINDLIKRLEADRDAEATTKSYCDTQMGKETLNRDNAYLQMETEGTTISANEAKKASLLEDIKVLSEEVADMRKGLLEAQELRNNDKATNAKIKAEAIAGKEAVDNAIQILSAYYGTDLLQAGRAKANQPEGADREDLTVADRAPEMSYSGEYSGRQDAGTGIMSLLQIISDDFARTIDTITTTEGMSESEFQKYESAANTDIDGKDGDIDTKKAEVTSAETAITDAKDAKYDAENLHKAAVAALEDLQAMCVAGEETWEERKKSREREIEALKEALKILDEWKS